MIRLLTVGQCGIELDGKRLSTESEIVFGLLLYLAARAGDAVSREEAQALFWPELSHTRGRHCLRQAAYRLRQLGVPLRSDNSSLSVALGDVTSDFAPLIADEVPAAAYRDAAVGDILPAYQPTFSAQFAAWVEEYRARIALRIRQGLVRTLVDLRSKGRYREAEPLARVCLTADPFNEVATLTLAESTAVLSGNRAEAMAILDRYMDEIGETSDRRLALSASVLRRRISERFVEQRYAAPPEPPFVGREDVLQLMVEKMQEAVTGRSSIVYLWGEPGIGKTRLLDELAKVAHVQGVRVERYTVSPNDPDRPLALFSALLPRLMQIAGAAGISPESYEAIHRFIDPSVWKCVEPPGTVAEAEMVFGRLKRGIGELIEALAEERPLGLFVDDVHWMDARSLEVLSEVVDRVRGRRVVFALTSRESLSRTGRSALEALCARAAVRRLDGLRAEEIVSLLTCIGAQRNFHLTSEFVRRTVDISAGNPLFVSELATHYGWNGVREDLPHNMQTLLQKRLDALSPDALLVFQVCAVLAEHSTVERLTRVLQSPTHSMLLSLAEVERASLLVLNSELVMCRHSLLRAEALGRLTPIARQALSRKSAIVLEEAAFNEMSSALCWHAVQAWLDARQPGRALQLVTTMAGRLLGSGLAKDADGLLQRARDVLRDAPTATHIIPLQWRAARAIGNLERSRDLALECQRLEQQIGSSHGEATYAEFAAFDASRLLDFGALRHGFDIGRLANSEDPPDVLIEVAIRILVSADDILEPATAHQCFEALNSRNILQRAPSDRRVLFEMLYHSHFGTLDLAVDRARRIVSAKHNGRRNDLSIEVRQRRWAHRPLLLAGRFDEALAALDQSISFARRCESVFDEVVSLCYRVETLLIADRLHEAEVALDSIERKSPQTLCTFVLASSYLMRAYVMFARESATELGSALECAERDTRYAPFNRNQVGIDALRVFESLMRREVPDAVRIDRLTLCADVVRSMSSADAPILALCTAALARREPTIASKLCSDYRMSRRERFPVTPCLARPVANLLASYGTQVPDEVAFLLSR